uniref:Uncharacterized protein n=1 Tax=Anopheles minimus TaxID=112268 RepID=A0A182WQ92_9DIPT
MAKTNCLLTLRVSCQWTQLKKHTQATRETPPHAKKKYQHAGR